ncbi:DUF2567 domain-containing protein [Gordonia insulae]|uniref:DUF2567 domain-containing protein n=1 Tax=Gordonia insulae TaxID=2420509 RepID=A0A3G8JGV0_9ACTN|nr:DUF2567 domain-containing protein [Gordonia insulae]AZG43752.1 hypothetical protein D7316_00321 [Gordonia insulae]
MTDPAAQVSGPAPAEVAAPGSPVTERGPHSPVRPLIVALGAVVLLGVVVGMIWAMVTPAMSGRVVGPESAIIPAEQFPEEFAGVGVFALMQLGYGLAAVLVVWFACRRWRGPAGFMAVAAATVIGSLLGAWLGTAVADWRFDDPLTLPVGATFRVVPDLWLDGAVRGGPGGVWALFICAPLAAALVYLGAALASRTADLGVGDLVEAPDHPESGTDGQPI